MGSLEGHLAGWTFSWDGPAVTGSEGLVRVAWVPSRWSLEGSGLRAGPCMDVWRFTFHVGQGERVLDGGLRP